MFELDYTSALFFSDKRRFPDKILLKHAKSGLYRTRCDAIPVFLCASAQRCWRTITFRILQASFQGHQPSGLSVQSLRVVFRDCSLIILVCLVRIYSSGFRFFLSHLLPFLPSAILAPCDHHMLLVYDTYTSAMCFLDMRCQKGALYWLSQHFQTSSHSLLIIKRRHVVRQLWLYSPPFPSPLEHLFCHDDICLPCNEK